MCLLNFVLLFEINYRCNYGEAVYVVGNIAQLGAWNPQHALKLNWTEGHNWTHKLHATHDNTRKIEYKYIVAAENISAISNNIRWENGPNRCVDLLAAHNLFVKLFDEWEHIKVKIMLSHNIVKRHLNNLDKQIGLYTNICLVKAKREMKLERDFGNGLMIKENLFWTASFFVPNHIPTFFYQYKIESNDAKEIISDRKERTFSLTEFAENSKPKNGYSIFGSALVKYDYDLKSFLDFDVITDDILVGAFPHNHKDIKDISALGVKGVLNLQTFEDMEKHGTVWESLQELYSQANIKAVHFPISDMNIQDLILKMGDAAKILEGLVKNGKVYVHCTAGRFRSPNITIFYLCHYRSFTLKEAMELIKSKRSKIKTTKKIFTTCFDRCTRDFPLKNL